MSFLQAAKEHGLPRIVSIQNSYSLLTRTAYETDLAEVCCERNGDVGLLAYSPLAGGVLSGKFLTPEAPDGARLNLFPGYMGRYRNSDSEAATREYAALAKKHGMTPSQLALAWCKSRWFITSSIIGATSLEQLKENIDAFDIDLSDEALDDIAAVYKRYRDPTINPAEKQEAPKEEEKKEKQAA
jgi:aryl-alcohol dehydrogenase-like predicted oxidoreductase